MTYETDAKNCIQQQLRDALDHIFSLFEMMYAYGDHHLVHTISKEYLLFAIRNTELIFVSSRCRTCYRGTSHDTTPRHRRDVFMDQLLSMTNIHRTPFVKAEDTMALRILDRCSLNRLGPAEDPFLLGFTGDDFRRITKLPKKEQERFHADVAALLAVNQLPILKNRKGVDMNYAPMWPAHLDEQCCNFLLHQRCQFGLAAAKHILSRYEMRQAKLFRFFSRNE